MTKKILFIIILVIILIMFFFLVYSCTPAQDNRKDLSLFLTATNFIDGDQIGWLGIDQIQNEQRHLVNHKCIYSS